MKQEREMKARVGLNNAKEIGQKEKRAPFIASPVGVESIDEPASVYRPL